METFLAIIILLVYFLPTAISTFRDHNNQTPIWVFNVLLGWTVIGWIAALIWSLTDNVKKYI